MSETQDTKFPKSLIQATVCISVFGGTGFLCSFPFDYPDTFFVVSNKHVLTNFTEKTGIFPSCPPNEYYKRTLRPLSNKVYSHPDKNIDLACVVASQSIYVPPERFDLPPLTWDYFTKPQTPISSSSKLTVVGSPKDESQFYQPLIQEEHLVCDISLKDHHLAIKPHLNRGASGSPVFIGSDRRFFVLGVVERKLCIEKQEGNFWVSIIIKQRYVSELLKYATESFKQHHGTTPVPPRKTIYVKL
ncbi:trypsin-like peptidase domain-containing protein [Candidatus Poribacteria bacterium]|nr:trypsin-like peptidase domain-containing protein [Candidatus Poribacteria bacterium]